MQTLHLSIVIHAPREKVWNTMLGDSTYREWTKPFNPGGSYFKGNWEQGTKMLFLGPSPEGQGEGGMLSYVQENRPYEFISLSHKGMIMNGVEDTESEMVQPWIGAIESYTFNEVEGGTEVLIKCDVADTEKEQMGELWKKSLQALKEIAER